MCVFFYFFLFFGGVWRKNCYRGNDVEFDGSRESTRQRNGTPPNKPLLSIHWGKKIIGVVVGVTRHTHEICALPKKKFTRTCCATRLPLFVQQINSWNETINNRVWLFVGLGCSLFRAQLPSSCIFCPLIFSSIQGKIKFSLRKVHNCQSEFFPIFFWFFLTIYLLLN